LSEAKKPRKIAMMMAVLFAKFIVDNGGVEVLKAPVGKCGNKVEREGDGCIG
jgi:hypothetical protein